MILVENSHLMEALIAPVIGNSQIYPGISFPVDGPGGMAIYFFAQITSFKLRQRKVMVYSNDIIPGTINFKLSYYRQKGGIRDRQIGVYLDGDAANSIVTTIVLLPVFL